MKDEPPKPAIVQVDRPVPIPGQLKRITPRASRRGAVAKLRPSEVIREANRKATDAPNVDDYFNAIATYDYMPGRLYQIYTAPQKLTDIQLRPGEKIIGKPATGDNIRWVLARGASSAGGVEQQHIYIKPTRPDLDTTLAINTDQRSYILELHSYEDAWMAAIAWRYDTVSGNYLLIPQGSRLLATYDSAVTFGQERVLVCWNRLIRPDGSSIPLECMPGVDLSGQAGFADQVDNHWWRIITGVALGTLVSATAQRSQGDVSGYSPTVPQLWAANAGGAVNQAGQAITQKNLAIQPTIKIRPGFSVNVIVTKDIVLAPYTAQGVLR